MNTGNRNRTRTRLIISTLVAALAVAATAIAADQPAPATTMTVYVGMNLGKKNAAKDLNAMHEKMAKEGWRFADMETNVENGDTEGFWVTYTRP